MEKIIYILLIMMGPSIIGLRAKLLKIYYWDHFHVYTIYVSAVFTLYITIMQSWAPAIFSLVRFRWSAI